MPISSVLKRIGLRPPLREKTQLEIPSAAPTRRPRVSSKRAAFVLVLLLASGIGLRGDNNDARFQRLGQKLICMCGCYQGLLVCNHVGCTVVTKMRTELSQRVATKDPDNLILQAFMQEYGSSVVAVPSTHGFNLLAWVMPWVAAALGLAFLLWVIRYWSRHRAAPAAGSPAPRPAQVEAVHNEVERELQNLFGESGDRSKGGRA